MIIKTHVDLAKLIKNKKVLHLNSLGKDSVLCLEWLSVFAKPSKIVSLNFKFQAAHPKDDAYAQYLKNRYPKVEFIFQHDPAELSELISGLYQSPVQLNHYFNHFEYDDFERSLVTQEILDKTGCDYICRGASAYEGFGRAIQFHKKGLLQDKYIYPLGFFQKKEVYSLIKKTGIKLHPSYAESEGTHDHPSYWKMKRAFDKRPDFKKKMLEVYPLLELDIYRYEVLFAKK